MWPPHEESNLDFRFRRPVFYPLNYGEAVLKLYGGPSLRAGGRIIPHPDAGTDDATPPVHRRELTPAERAS